MFKNKCFVCEIKEATQRHHLIPQVINYKYDKTIDVCDDCHNAIHEVAKRGNHKELTKIGIQKAKERGVVIGRRKGSKKRDISELSEKEKIKREKYIKNKLIKKEEKKQDNFYLKARQIIERFKDENGRIRNGCKLNSKLAKLYYKQNQTFLDNVQTI